MILQFKILEMNFALRFSRDEMVVLGSMPKEVGVIVVAEMILFDFMEAIHVELNMIWITCLMKEDMFLCR